MIHESKQEVYFLIFIEITGVILYRSLEYMSLPETRNEVEAPQAILFKNIKLYQYHVLGMQ